ncbi:MAG: tetratricopeptide repeat protein [Pseudomonadota bacterium]
MKIILSLIFLGVTAIAFSDSRTPKKFNMDQRAQFLTRNRAHLIEEIKNALRIVKSEDQTAELRLRLANLFLEEFKDQNSKGADAKSYLQKAHGILKDLAKSPSFPRRDEVLFQLAQSYLELSQPDRANDLFVQLVTQFQTSPFSEEAYLQLGEAAFDKGQFAKSIIYFEKLTSNPQSSLWQYAHYKSGWANYNLNQLSKTLFHFRAIVEQDSGASSQSSIALKKEAIQDLCLPLAESKQYDEGVQFYSEQGETFYRSGVECLASMAREKGDLKQALSLYGTLLRLDFQHQKNPSYHLSIVNIFRNRNQFAEAFAGLEEASSLYLGDSTWKEIFSSNPVYFKEVSDEIEGAVRGMGLECHSTAQKTKNLGLYEQARSFHELYLKYFPQSPNAPQIEFYLAEIYFKTKHFSQAAKAYAQVFQNNRASLNLRKESLEYAVLASSKEVNFESKISDFSENDEFFVKLSEQYAENFPKDSKTPQFLFKSNHIKYLRQQSKRAYLGFWHLVQHYPKSESAPRAALLLLDILKQKEDYKNLVAACKAIKRIPELKSQKFISEVGDILRKSELKQIALLEETGDFQMTGKAYLTYIQEYGSEDSSLHEKALYNATVCFLKSNDSTETLRTQELFLKLFPSSTFRKDMLLQVAKSYEAMAELGKAAHAFSTFQREYPGSPQSKEALRLAGLYFWGDGRPEIAETTMLKLMQTYPEFRNSAEKDLIDLYTSERWFEKQFDYLLKARTVKGISFAHYVELTLQLADLQEQHFQKPAFSLWNEAEGVIEKHREMIQSSSTGPDLIGRVLLRKTLRKEADFESIRLILPQAALEKSLAQKLRLLKELENDFSEIARLGGDYGLAAFFYTSQAYLNLFQEIDSAPIPAELSAEQSELYRQELSTKMTTPLREMASNYAKQCLEKSREMSVFSPWASKCGQITSQLNPDLYPQISTVSLPPYLLAMDKGNSHYFLSSPLFKEALKDGAFSGKESGVRLISLQSLGDYRQQPSEHNLDDESRETREQDISYFNSLRLKHPAEAISKLKHHLRTKNQDPVFHQLLAMAYLDNGDWVRAKITWLALIARGILDPGIYNNLGVLEAVRGNAKSAMGFFEEAKEKGSREALMNQGFIALIWGNGYLARSLFEKSLEESNHEIARMGLAIAKIQSNDLENGKAELDELQKQFPGHPLIYQQRLALTKEPQRNQSSLPELE